MVYTIPLRVSAHLSSELILVSKSILYWKPEQPPPSTITLSSRPGSSSLTFLSCWGREGEGEGVCQVTTPGKLECTHLDTAVAEVKFLDWVSVSSLVFLEQSASAAEPSDLGAAPPTPAWRAPRGQSRGLAAVGGQGSAASRQQLRQWPQHQRHDKRGTEEEILFSASVRG